MATLCSVYHDFSRLAKESGFYFQLHTGRVNWSEIENLNIDEIIEKRNFQLLEDNLINIINCNLEREYDLKILDPNFVKLFRLAQLGVDYLSYCEMYLDRCVVLLQEQLTACQEECESLKKEKQRRKEEFNKGKRKNKTPSYQCEKCEKVFISDVYLKFHDKRRHNVPGSPNSVESVQKKCMDNWQQTEVKAKLSTSTQTFCLDDAMTITQECVDRDNIKIEHTIKIEKLEEELKNLKERLKKTESSLIQKAEGCHPNQSDVFQPLNVSGSMYYNPMLMLLPSYLKQPENNSLYEIKPGCQLTVPVSEVSKPHCSETPVVNSEVGERKTESYSFPKLNTKIQKENEFSVKCLTKSAENFQITRKEVLECDKEKIDQNISKNTTANVRKPLPPPRKLKKGSQTQLSPLNPTLIEELTAVKDTQSEEITEEFAAAGSIVDRSTQIKENENKDVDQKNFEASTENLSLHGTTNSSESLDSRKSVMVDHETKSFVQKIVAKSSPRLRRFSNNLKRSLTNIYGSVSSAEKESTKNGRKEQNIKATMISGINNRLRELGVDPEWHGIPKKTMKQKLNVLKYKRKMLSKEYPLFPVFRQNIEEKIFKKLKSSFRKKKAVINNKLNKQKSMSIEELSNEDVTDKPDFVKVKSSAMYDIASDSESDTSDLKNLDQALEQSSLEKIVVLEEFNNFSKVEQKLGERDKEFDFSVFQVGRGSLNSLSEQNDTQQNLVYQKQKLFSDSDSEDDFLGPSDEKLFKMLNGLKNDKNQEGNNETENYEDMESHSEFSFLEKQVDENQSILKNSETFPPRPSATKKKKVFFANYAPDIEETLSDSPVDDDLWPFKSDSEKDV